MSSPEHDRANTLVHVYSNLKEVIDLAWGNPETMRSDCMAALRDLQGVRRADAVNGRARDLDVQSAIMKLEVALSQDDKDKVRRFADKAWLALGPAIGEAATEVFDQATETMAVAL